MDVEVRCRNAIRRLSIAWLSLLLALAGGECLAAEGLPGKTIPQSLGFNVHLTGPDQEWDQIKAAGVAFVRKDLDWGGTERAKGQYDFGPFDRMLDGLEKRGLRAIFILDYRNRLYPAPETSEEGRDAFARWAVADAGCPSKCNTPSTIAPTVRLCWATSSGMLIPK